MMKIGIDCRMYGSAFTGIGRYCFELVRNLAVIDEENEYVLFFNEPEYSGFVPPNERFSKVFAGAKHYSAKEQTGFYLKIKKQHLDLMHFTHFNAPILYRDKSIVTIHDLTLSFFPGKKMKGILHRAAYQAVIGTIVKKAKKIIAVSENTKKDLIRILHVPEDKISVIYEGIASEVTKISDRDFFKKIEKKYKLPRKFLLYTGVWRYHKNIVGLLEAFAILKNKFGFDGGLVLTGKPDPVYPEVVKTIERLKIGDSVISTGLVPEKDLVGLLNLARVYVFPSFYEGFGLPILEAFACGTPVAASNLSSIPEICGEGNALLFNPYNSEEMAEKINSILVFEPLRKQLIERGMARAKFFDWAKMARQTLKVYTSII